MYREPYKPAETSYERRAAEQRRRVAKAHARQRFWRSGHGGTVLATLPGIAVGLGIAFLLGLPQSR